MVCGTASRFPAKGIKIIVTENKEHFFFEHYGLTNQDLERYLAAALSAGGDYADLYFEYLTSTSLMVDESMVKSASQGIRPVVAFASSLESAPDTRTLTISRQPGSCTPPGPLR